MFINRREAGRKLAELLDIFRGEDSVVLGVPRGGVIVAAEVAKDLAAPLDLIIPRKIGAPFNPEVAVGAITQDGTMILDENLIGHLNISKEELAEEASIVKEEIGRRLKKYRGSKDFPELKDKVVIIVDDGIATGYTIRAALESAKRYMPKKVVLAVPVAPRDTIERLKTEVDEVVCPLIVDDFYAVGQFYKTFDQTTDQEVIDELRNLP